MISTNILAFLQEAVEGGDNKSKSSAAKDSTESESPNVSQSNSSMMRGSLITPPVAGLTGKDIEARLNKKLK